MTGYSGDLPPDRFNLARYCLASSAWDLPDKTALTVVGDSGIQTLTFAEIEDTVLRMVSGFRLLGLETGDRVIIRMGNSFAYAAVFFAANAAGLVPIPLSAMLSVSEVAFMLADSGARAIVHDATLPIPDDLADTQVVGPGDLDAFRHASRGTYADTTARAPAYMVYTSGTSGRPKGVLHAQRAAWGRRPMYEGWYGLKQDDTILHTGAFNWTYTLGTGLCDPWANGAGSIIYTGKRDRSVWLKLIDKLNPTIMASVPTIYRQMLNDGGLSPACMNTLRHALTAGETMPAAILKEWVETTGIQLYEALGMSEISTYISSSPSVPVVPGSPGRPQRGRCVAILPVGSGETPLPPNETGLIAVHRSDPGMMLGYWNRPDEEHEVFRGDWFVGGDLGYVDERGYIWFQGRNDDVMTSFGYRISPQEIENVLERHPGVFECGVTEVEINPGIRLVTAFVVARDNVRVAAEEITDFASAHLARYKVPKQVFFFDALPRTSNGKIKRKALPALLNQSKDHANDG